MANTSINVRLVLKNDNATNIAASELVALKGEPVLIIDTDNKTGVLRFGDGVTKIKELPDSTMTPAAIEALIGTKIAADTSHVKSVSLASGTNNGTLKITVDGVATDNIAVRGLGSAAYTNSNAYATAAQGTLAANAMPKSGGTFTGAITLSADPAANMQPATKQYVDKQITDKLAASDAMVFKGTVGTSGTATTLPTSGIVKGDTYKCVSAITVDVAASYTGSAVTTKTGDLVVAMDSSKWIVVPSGDERETFIKYSKTACDLTTDAKSGTITLAEGATKQVDDTIAAASKSTNIPTSEAVAKFVEGKGYKTTDNDSKVKNTLNTSTKFYLTGTTSAETNTGEQIFDTGVYVDTAAGTLVATALKGALTGNVTGNVSGSSGSCTGNSKTATSLQTARNFSITGGAKAAAVAFNGGANCSLNVTEVNTDVLKNGSNTLVLDGGAA